MGFGIPDPGSRIPDTEYRFAFFFSCAFVSRIAPLQNAGRTVRRHDARVFVVIFIRFYTLCYVRLDGRSRFIAESHARSSKNMCWSFCQIIHCCVNTKTKFKYSPILHNIKKDKNTKRITLIWYMKKTINVATITIQ